jgi:hypothetical protein
MSISGHNSLNGANVNLQAVNENIRNVAKIRY